MQKFNFKTVSLFAALALATVTGCMSSGHNDGRTAGQAKDDRAISEQVENRLNREPVYKFTNVDVKTFGGIVQLSGFVDTEGQKQRAGEIAQHIAGVNRVENAIALKPTTLTPTGRTNNVPATSTKTDASNPSLDND